jgi:hypothetical protein
MKRLLLYVCTALLLTGCANEMNDRLQGKWQLTSVEEQETSLPVDTVYYNFQTSLFMFQIYSPANNTYSHCYGFKTVAEDSLLRLELTSYNVPVAKFLPQTDWEASTRDFVIKNLTDSRLVLQNKDRTYTFRKF